MSPPLISKPVPGASQFYTLNEPPAGTLYDEDKVSGHNAHPPVLLQPITIRGVTFKNRVFVSPMCQYSSDNGHASDWHLVHIGAFAVRGAGAICMEATAVVPEGRISPEDAGLWTDSQMPILKRIVDFAHTQGTLIGVQLAHAGRKASTLSPWVAAETVSKKTAERNVALENENGWPDNVWSASDVPFGPGYPTPKAMTEEHMDYVEKAFVEAAERCKQIGFDFIEIHGAHGYLLHNFLSPLSNTRTDKWGGPAFENRIRFPLRIVQRVREAWKDKPLFVRISASDWHEEPEKVNGEWSSWGIEQSTTFVGELQKLGVDLVDVSSGGNYHGQRIPIGPGYQTHFAAHIKSVHPSMPLSTVGLITSPTQANDYIAQGKADVVSLARELLRKPDWVLEAAQELGAIVKAPNQYERAWTRMLLPKH